MNAMQHYQLAEKLLKFARENADADGDYLVASAQAHATLALTAVQAMGARWYDTSPQWRATFDPPGGAS